MTELATDELKGIKELSSQSVVKQPVPRTNNSVSERKQRTRLPLNSLDDTLRATALNLRAAWGDVKAGKLARPEYARMLRLFSQQQRELAELNYLRDLRDEARRENDLEAARWRVIDVGSTDNV